MSEDTAPLRIDISNVTDYAELNWPSSADRYEVMNILGRGSSACVVSAYCKDFIPQLDIAIKQIDLEQTTADLDEIQKEMLVMRACRHPNLVSYYTSFVYQKELWVVMKLLDRGSVLDIISYKEKKVAKGGILDEYVIATILKFVLEGLAYLHAQGHVHRDVKAGNILIAADGQVQLADFGVSTWLAENQFIAREKAETKGSKKNPKSIVMRKTFVGTPCWMAPEVMEQTGYNEKADIWSLGITALEMATGSAPYAKFEPMRVLLLTMENDPPTLDTCGQFRGQDYSNYDKKFRKFVADCLQKAPEKRPSAAELLKSDFIKKFAKEESYLVRSLLESMPQAGNYPPRDVKKNAKTRESMGMSGWDFDVPTESNRRNMFADNPVSGAIEPNPNSNPAQQQQQQEQQEQQEQQQPEVATEQPPAVQEVEMNTEAAAVTHPLRLKVRDLKNPQALLRDISFSMTSPPDTFVSIAEELVGSDLIRPLDCAAVAEAIKKIISDPEVDGITFPLYGTEMPADFDMYANHEKPPEGFAQIMTGAKAQQAPVATV